MSRDYVINLEWLLAPPQDFSAACRGLPKAGGEAGKQARFLASHALDENQLNKLAKALRATHAQNISLAPMQPFRLGIVSNATLSFLAPALEATAARHGIALQCIETEFGQVMQEALSPQSAINQAKVDAVLVAVDHRGLPLKPSPGDAQAGAQSFAKSLQQMDLIRNGLHQHGNAICILQTLPRPVESLFGSYDSVISGGMRNLVDQYNQGLIESLAGTHDVLFDVAHLAETVGLAEWHDPTLWNMAKLPFASRFLPIYAEHLCRIIAAMRGKSRRCLILDLDNTVWGGVIGDDGIEGIVIGQGNATGEAFLDVQRAALALRDRGVVLAVSSKNTDEIARAVFRKHPEMLLREDHIAVFQANWNDKATNIKAIAEELSLGLDAMVFLDDNPAERELVRRILPQVAVPELPADPALYARSLFAAGYFESIGFSDEDKKRASFYQENARRVELQKQAGDVDAYLASLNMQMQVRRFDETGRARIAQLISKSNQFNLTTRRYGEAEVAQIQNDAACLGMQVRLADCFGDNGMISVIVCRQDSDTWDIDLWLMSCRVLGRKVEQALLQVLCTQARLRGIHRLMGSYIPTERNALVKDHYAKLGFSQIDTRSDGTTIWQFDVDALPLAVLPMEIQCVGLDPDEQTDEAATEPIKQKAAA